MLQDAGAVQYFNLVAAETEEKFSQGSSLDQFCF